MIGEAAQAGVLVGLRPRARRAASLLWLVRRKPLGAVALLLILGMVALAVGADVISPYDIDESFRGHKLDDPFGQFLLGTDHQARDVLSRVVHGARIAMTVATASVALGIALGSIIGLLSGYLEGAVDLAAQRVMDAQLAFPNIILALAIVAVIGPGMLNIIIAIAIILVPESNRVVRGAVLAAKQHQYVDAARAIGCGTGRIVFRHLLPNVAAPIMVIASLALARSILTEANLSFLGVGLPATEPSWGSMLSVDARRYLLAQPWLGLWPGLAICLAILGWNMLGDALRDLLDPRLRGSR
ncbi:MAG: ABC transporter permease [Chloroflexi bacterium]|nr:ABC transporter permease [Chloroflexota bacterium]